MCAHTFIRGEILSAISVTQYGALTVDLLFFIGNNSGALGKPKTLRTGSCAREVEVRHLQVTPSYVFLFAEDNGDR